MAKKLQSEKEIIQKELIKKILKDVKVLKASCIDGIDGLEMNTDKDGNPKGWNVDVDGFWAMVDSCLAVERLLDKLKKTI